MSGFDDGWDVSERYFESAPSAGAVREPVLAVASGVDDGGRLLDGLVGFLRRFVIVTEPQADALVLWIAHTHAIGAADATPYLNVTSAEKRSGKTRLGEVLELLVREPLTVANISEAALFRAVDALTPTVLLDEADALFKAREREDLRGLMNAGHRRGAVVYRIGGANNTKLDAFQVFSPKAFFGIGDYLPDTIADRAIEIRLERRTRDEDVDRFRRREAKAEADELREALASWLAAHLEELEQARPGLPDELDDRAQDSWEPILAIAELAGGAWPERARRAAFALSTGEQRGDDSLTSQLVRDIHAVFAEAGDDRLPTAELIRLLSAIEESPWGDWYGKAITPQGLSKLLKPYRIKTMPIWFRGQTCRGYKAEQFHDAWRRLGVRPSSDVRPEGPSEAGPNGASAPNAARREAEQCDGPETPHQREDAGMAFMRPSSEEVRQHE